MEIHSIGINYVHKNGVIINRPEGSGDYLLIIFKSAAYISLGGEWKEVMPDSAILFSKGSQQLYGNENALYINHCIHMDFDKNESILEAARLETDRVFPLYNVERVEAMMKEISYEFYAGNEQTDMAMLLLRVLFYRLGESYKAYRTGELRTKKAYENEMKMLRSEIYSTPSTMMSVPQMAQRLNISVPHFQRLYKKYFGISCYDDVVSARIALAKEYLKSTLLSVNEVAALCGYTSYEHFIRQFKVRTGYTPYKYRHIHFECKQVEVYEKFPTPVVSVRLEN